MLPTASILLTSSVPVGGTDGMHATHLHYCAAGGVADLAEKVYTLQPLQPLDAAMLFEQVA
jgi:hypothetical protein